MLVIRKDTKVNIESLGDAETIEIDTLRKWIKDFSIVRRIRYYDGCQVWVYDIDNFTRPFAVTFIARIITKGNCVVRDDKNNLISIDSRYLFKQLILTAFDILMLPFELFFSLRALKSIKNYPDQRKLIDKNRNVVLYLKTDLVFGPQTGGSVTHTAGVVNGLAKEGFKVDFVSFSKNPLIDNPGCQKIICMGKKYLNKPEVRGLYSNRLLLSIEKDYQYREVRFIYQRYSMYNYTGLVLSKRLGLPLVLEFNGSEIWISKNWGNGKVGYEFLAKEIEVCNLRYADLVVVVSDAQAASLIECGVAPEKILVNPNGVDSEIFHPNVSGESVRDDFELEGKVVIGFVGTFGIWHGVPVLVKAIEMLLNRRENLKSIVRVLMVGDGKVRNEVLEYVTSNELSEYFIFCGEVPQSSSHMYMAACDILVCCNIPNPDGTRFFGSPTKLFEYMSMGKAVVASDLEQVGEIVKSEKAGIVVEPGDSFLLSEAIETLIDDREKRAYYAMMGRKAIEEKYNWGNHVSKILRRLDDRCL